MSGPAAARAGYDPPQRLRKQPSWLIDQLGRRAQDLVNEALAQEGVRRQHFAVLASLAEQGPASQADLGRRLWIDRSDLHAILRRLEADRRVARVRDPRDRRRKVVTLTAVGAAALERLEARVQSAQNALLAPLSPGERRELQWLLETLLEHAQG